MKKIFLAIIALFLLALPRSIFAASENTPVADPSTATNRKRAKHKQKQIKTRNGYPNEQKR